MSNEFKFTWSRMGLCFPEWKKDMKEEDFNHYFPSNPDFSSKQISFAYKNEYGIQLHLNNEISPWLVEGSKEYKMIAKMHSDLSHKLYEETLKELDTSFDIFEGWRKFVSKRVGTEWKGNLQSNLDFTNESDQIRLGDYYRFNINSDYKDNSPTDVLHKIQKLPEDSLNDKWKKYVKLAENVSIKEKGSASNEIIGKDFAECIKNADEIYKLTQELKELKF